MTMMRTDADGASLYQELNEQQDEIQLLRVLPQADNSAINCILETHSLQDLSDAFARFHTGCQNASTGVLYELLRDPDSRRRC
jgi:hypothetical protein